jgi:hypothetical protein
MYCENKNYLIDLYFLDGNKHRLKAIRKHLETCDGCRDYYASIKNTMDILDKLEEEKPAESVFDKVLIEVSGSAPELVRQKMPVSLFPILKIALGQIFLFGIIYILNLKLPFFPVWGKISDYWLVQTIGSIGISIIIVLCIGTFLTLSFAPILFLESKDKRSFGG